MWIKREQAEGEVFKWLAREAAPGFDAAPSVPQQRTEMHDERVQAARERARLQREADQLARALVNLRTDWAMNPDDYGPGAYDAARHRIRTQQAANRKAMERVAEVEATPHRADYETLIVGTAEEWETLDVRERNAILK